MDKINLYLHNNGDIFIDAYLRNRYTIIISVTGIPLSQIIYRTHFVSF